MKRLYILLIYFVAVYGQQKKALIFGVTGQDGSYLAEFLLEKGYEVHGVKRRASSRNTKQIDYLCADPNNANRFFLHHGDLTDTGSIYTLIDQIRPDEIYNLGAQTHVPISYEMPEYTSDVNAIGTLRILEVIRNLNLIKKVRFYQPSTSELYGVSDSRPRTESTPFHPRSPYAVSKLFAHWTTVNYREAFGLFACNGILFNHESPRRGENFVTRKIIQSAFRIAHGAQEICNLGNLNARRDWGYAKDYVEAMWLSLQQEKPDDFIIASGESHSVREFVELAFKEFGIEIEWKGSGIEEVGYNKKTGVIVVQVNPAFFRPNDVNLVIGDPQKAKNILKWQPKTSFNELVKIMASNEKENLSPCRAIE